MGASTSEDSRIAALKVLSLFRSALIRTLGAFGLVIKETSLVPPGFPHKALIFDTPTVYNSKE